MEFETTVAFLQKIQHKKHILVVLLIMLALLWDMKFKRLSKYHNKLKLRKPRLISKKPISKQRNSISHHQFEIFDMCGLFEDDFEELFLKVKDKLTLSRTGKKLRTCPTVLTPRARLLLVLSWLREYPGRKIFIWTIWCI